MSVNKIDSGKLATMKAELDVHLENELLPFWLARAKDSSQGGFITQFDRQGADAGTDEKSLIAQARMTFAMALAARSSCKRDECLDFVRHGVRYMIDRMWDPENNGFYWMTDRKGMITVDKKILYGQSFAIYALAEASVALEGEGGEALSYAERTFDTIMAKAADLRYGGFFEMFSREWKLAGPGKEGGDRKTLDVHMHLMEAFTSLAAATGKNEHLSRLAQIVDLLCEVIYAAGAGKPQFWEDWSPAPQIKFDVIWGWDRFAAGGVKANALDNASYGHDMEFLMLLFRALDVLEAGGFVREARRECAVALAKRIVDRIVKYGIDRECGGVFVEGPADGPATDFQKEFWQQAEVMTGSLEAYIRLIDKRCLDAYENVHRFVFDKMITKDPGEWLPLLERDGRPVWTHMGTSWKINYHTIRAVIESSRRISAILKQGL